MCWDTAGCVKSSATAASENEPRTATSRNVVRSLRSSITDHYVMASNSSLDMIDGGGTILSMNNLTIRSATAADAAALARLAAARQRPDPGCSAVRRRARRPPDRRRLGPRRRGDRRPVHPLAPTPWRSSAAARARSPAPAPPRRRLALLRTASVCQGSPNPRARGSPYERPRAPGPPPRIRCGSAMRRRTPTPLRQPRLRGEHAGPGRRLGRRRGVRAVVQQRPPRHGRQVAASRPPPTRGAREVVAGFVGAPREHDVVFVRNTTEAINVLANALPAGTRVLSTPVEHHANMLPWRRHDLRLLPVHHLGRRAARGRHATRCGHAGSTCSPSPAPPTSPARCGRSSSSPTLAHEHGAQLFVDAAQLAPHRAIDMAGARHRPPRALGPQALRAVRRGRPRQPHPARRRRRCCTAAARSSSSRSTTSSGPRRPSASRPARRT